MFILQLDPVQLVFMADVLDALDRAGQIPAGRAQAFAALRQQLAAPQLASAVVDQVRAQLAQQATPQPQ